MPWAVIPYSCTHPGISYIHFCQNTIDWSRPLWLEWWNGYPKFDFGFIKNQPKNGLKQAHWARLFIIFFVPNFMIFQSYSALVRSTLKNLRIWQKFGEKWRKSYSTCPQPISPRYCGFWGYQFRYNRLYAITVKYKCLPN